MTTVTPEADAPVEYSISEKGRRQELHQSLEAMDTAEESLGQIWFREGLRATDNVDRGTTWLLEGFTEDALAVSDDV